MLLRCVDCPELSAPNGKKLLRHGWASFVYTAMISSQFRVSPDPAVEKRNRGEEKENADLFRESQLLSLPCASSPHMSQETPQLAQMTDLREKSNHAKPPTRTDFPVIEDGNNRTKDRFFAFKKLSLHRSQGNTKFKANIPVFSPHCLEIWKKKILP